MDEIFIYWIDKYVKGYRKGVAHGSKDGLITLCKRKLKPMQWDGGYNNCETHNIECKKCLKALANFKH